MLKKTLLLLLCSIAFAHPAFGMNWVRNWFGYNNQAQPAAPVVVPVMALEPTNPTAPAVMDTKSTIKTYSPGKLFALTSLLIAKNPKTINALKKISPDAQKEFIKSTLSIYRTHQVFIPKEENEPELELEIEQLPIDQESPFLKDVDVALTDDIMIRIDADLSALVIYNHALDTVLEQIKVDTVEEYKLVTLKNKSILCKLSNIDNPSYVITWNTLNNKHTCQPIYGHLHDYGTCLVSLHELHGNAPELWMCIDGSYQNYGSVFEYFIFDDNFCTCIMDDGDIYVIDGVSQETTHLKVNGLEAYYDHSRRRVVVLTRQNTIAEWDVQAGKKIFESRSFPEETNLIDFESQFVVIELPNQETQIWDIKNNLLVGTQSSADKQQNIALDGLDTSSCLSSYLIFEDKVLFREKNILKLWNGAQQSIVDIGEDLFPRYLSNHLIAAMHKSQNNSRSDSVLKVWSTQDLELLYETEAVYINECLTFNAQKKQFETHQEALPLELMQSFDYTVNQMTSEQINYVLHCISEIAQTSTKEHIIIKLFNKKEYKSLPLHIQNALRNYLLAQPENKNFEAQGTSHKDTMTHQSHSRSRTAKFVRTLALAAAGGALMGAMGALTYKWFTNSSSNY